VTRCRSLERQTYGDTSSTKAIKGFLNLTYKYKECMDNKSGMSIHYIFIDEL
jgi:hypothetical protein